MAPGFPVGSLVSSVSHLEEMQSSVSVLDGLSQDTVLSPSAQSLVP